MSSPVRVYFDQNIVSAITGRDLPEHELTAIDDLMRLHQSGDIIIGVSRQSCREIERAQNEKQAGLLKGMERFEVAPEDHRFLGMTTQSDQHGGFTANPLVSDIVDEPLFAQLSNYLKKDDAQHLMYAKHNRYARFVTYDNHFLKKRAVLEQCCLTIEIRMPSELIAELRTSYTKATVKPARSEA